MPLHLVRPADERVDVVQFGLGESSPHVGRPIISGSLADELAHLRYRESRQFGDLDGPHEV